MAKPESPSAFSRRLPSAPGDVIAGKYRVVRELGRGGVGIVVEAEHIKLGQRVAIKLLDPFFVREPEVVERFEREARAMASLKSVHVTAVSDVDVLSDGTPYLVMELLSGRDMAAELRERQVLLPHEAVDLVAQACEGIAVVHASGIVHRDLKPSNLFIVPGPKGPLVKVMDFGISKFEGNEVTRTNSSLGTPAYMSPEQVRSPRDVDARTDVWSLGVILFRALAGALPFEGEGITGMSVAIVNDEPKRLEALRPDLPPELVELVARCLAKRRDERYRSADELRSALLAVRSRMEFRAQAPTIPFITTEGEEPPQEPGVEVLDSFVRSSRHGAAQPIPPPPTMRAHEALPDAALPAPAPEGGRRSLALGLGVLFAAVACLVGLTAYLVLTKPAATTIAPAEIAPAAAAPAAVATATPPAELPATGAIAAPESAKAATPAAADRAGLDKAAVEKPIASGEERGASPTPPASASAAPTAHVVAPAKATPRPAPRRGSGPQPAAAPATAAPATPAAPAPQKAPTELPMLL